MEWFFFLFMGALWFFSLFLAREKLTIARIALFAGASIIFGLLLSTGISFPSGSTSTISGSTTTQTLTYTTYTATLSGANSFPPLYGLSWLLIILGILGLIYLFLEVYRIIFAPQDTTVRWM